MGDKFTDMYFYLFYVWFMSFMNRMNVDGVFEEGIYEAALKINDEQFYLVINGCFIKESEDLEDVSVRKRVQKFLYKKFMKYGIVKGSDKKSLNLVTLFEDDNCIPMVYKFLGMKSIMIIPVEKGIKIQFNGNPHMAVYVSNDMVNPQIVPINSEDENFNLLLDQEKFKREFAQALQMKKDLYS